MNKKKKKKPKNCIGCEQNNHTCSTPRYKQQRCRSCLTQSGIQYSQTCIGCEQNGHKCSTPVQSEQRCGSCLTQSGIQYRKKCIGSKTRPKCEGLALTVKGTNGYCGTCCSLEGIQYRETCIGSKTRPKCEGRALGGKGTNGYCGTCCSLEGIQYRETCIGSKTRPKCEGRALGGKGTNGYCGTCCSLEGIQYWETCIGSKTRPKCEGRALTVKGTNGYCGACCSLEGIQYKETCIGSKTRPKCEGRALGGKGTNGYCGTCCSLEGIQYRTLYWNEAAVITYRALKGLETSCLASFDGDLRGIHCTLAAMTSTALMLKDQCERCKGQLKDDVDALNDCILFLTELLADVASLGERGDEDNDDGKDEAAEVALDVAEAISNVATTLGDASDASVGLRQLTYLRSVHTKRRTQRTARTLSNARRDIDLILKICSPTEAERDLLQKLKVVLGEVGVRGYSGVGGMIKSGNNDQDNLFVGVTPNSLSLEDMKLATEVILKYFKIVGKQMVTTKKGRLYMALGDTGTLASVTESIKNQSLKSLAEQVQRIISKAGSTCMEVEKRYPKWPLIVTAANNDQVSFFVLKLEEKLQNLIVDGDLSVLVMYLLESILQYYTRDAAYAIVSKPQFKIRAFPKDPSNSTSCFGHNETHCIEADSTSPLADVKNARRELEAKVTKLINEYLSNLANGPSDTPKTFKE